MNDWDFSPPPPSDLGDRDVDLDGHHLEGRRVAMLVCGGIAAFRTPMLARALRRQGASVTAFASRAALRYVTEDSLEWSTAQPVVTRLSARAEHLSDNAPFDAYLLPQATYNTINKVALGIADGVITTTLSSALGRMERGQASVLVVPTMHGSMHNSILTHSLRKLHAIGIRIVPPREAAGKHKIPSDETLVGEVCRALSRSPLLGQPILIADGATASSRHHAMSFAREISLRGAEVLMIRHPTNMPPPALVSVLGVSGTKLSRRHVLKQLATGRWQSAALPGWQLVEQVLEKFPHVFAMALGPGSGAHAESDLWVETLSEAFEHIAKGTARH